MLPRLLCLAVLCLPLHGHALTSEEIQRFIDEASRSKDGGEVVIPPGRHLIERPLQIRAAKRLQIVGLDPEITTLQLPPLAFAEAQSAAATGAREIAARRLQHLRPGMRLHIEAPGEVEPFTQKPRPYHLATVQAVEGSRILLKEPLRFPCPAGTLIRDAGAPNLFEIHAGCEAIHIGKLTLDGGRVEGDPPVRGHAQLCAIFAQGAYSDEKGPTGPSVKGLRVIRCFIQNCHGRGIALYACQEPLIEDCTIRDTTDEAIDFDHFTADGIARHNHIARSLVGVELNDASGCRVEQNDLMDCGTGIHLWRWCRQPGLNENNLILGNQIDRTTGNAIQTATGTRANTLRANLIHASGKNGILLAGEGQIVNGNRITASGGKDIAIHEGTHTLDPAR